MLDLDKPYGDLTVLAEAGVRLDKRGRRKDRLWYCICVCGQITTVRQDYLVRGHTTSCGCKRAKQCGDNFRTHGEGHHRDTTPEYRAWNEMKRRCYQPSCHSYPDYGGRGIQVCRRWLKSFPNFLSDMGRRPSSKHSLDRKDNDGDYTPSNCKWSTKDQQASNRRNCRYLTMDDRTQTLAAWSRETGIHRSVILLRINRHKWSVEKALTTPTDHQHRKLTYRGQTKNMTEWSAKTGIPLKILWGRLDRGWSVADALTKPVRKTTHVCKN